MTMTVLKRVRDPVTRKVDRDEVVLHTLIGIINRNNWSGDRKHFNRAKLIEYASRYQITSGEVVVGLRILRTDGHVEIDSYGADDGQNYVNITNKGRDAYHIPH